MAKCLIGIIGTKAAAKAWPIHKCEKLPIPQRWDSIFRLCHLDWKYLYGRKKIRMVNT